MNKFGFMAIGIGIILLTGMAGASGFVLFPGNTATYSGNVAALPGNWILGFTNGTTFNFNSTANFSIAASSTTSSTTSTTTSSTTVTSSTSTIPPTATVTCVNGEQQQQIGNVIINCPPSVFISLSVVPTNSSQTNTIIPIHNVSFTVNTAQITQANNNILLGFGSSINYQIINAVVEAPNNNFVICTLNSTVVPLWNSNISITNSSGSCSVSVKVLQIPRINKSFSASSGQTIYNGLYGINFTAKYLPINVNLSLGCGQNWTYSEINAIVRSPECLFANSIIVNDTVMQNYLNGFALRGCAPGANVIFFNNLTNTPIDVCTRLNNQSSPDIFTAIASYLSQNPSHNITQGLGQAYISSVEIANSTGVQWHEQFTSCYNHYESPLNYSSTANQLAFCTANENNAETYPTLFVYLLAAGFGGIMMIQIYFNMRRKQEKEEKRKR